MSKLAETESNRQSDDSEEGKFYPLLKMVLVHSSP